MKSHVYYHWQAPHRVWAFAVATRLVFGRCHSRFVRTWSFGPLTVALTDLTRQ